MWAHEGDNQHTCRKDRVVAYLHKGSDGVWRWKVITALETLAEGDALRYKTAKTDANSAIARHQSATETP